MPYEAITQPVMFITGEKDGALTKGAKKVHIPFVWQSGLVTNDREERISEDRLACVSFSGPVCLFL